MVTPYDDTPSFTAQSLGAVQLAQDTADSRGSLHLGDSIATLRTLFDNTTVILGPAAIQSTAPSGSDLLRKMTLLPVELVVSIVTDIKGMIN